MTRPRAMSSKYCIRCNVVPVSEWEAQQVAKHRLEHRRADRRRAQWREYKRTKKLADGRIGALHSLKCLMPVRCTCNAIPVFPKQQEVA